jgi:hypothetical protein
MNFGQLADSRSGSHITYSLLSTSQLVLQLMDMIVLEDGSKAPQHTSPMGQSSVPLHGARRDLHSAPGATHSGVIDGPTQQSRSEPHIASPQRMERIDTSPLELELEAEDDVEPELELVVSVPPPPEPSASGSV